MDRSAVVTFSGQLREARERAVRDSEAFESIIHVVERLGSFLLERIADLKAYKEKIEISASHRPLLKTSRASGMMFTSLSPYCMNLSE